MAILSEMNMKEVEKWLATRPPIIRESFEKRPANRLYRMKSSGHRCTIYSYSEDGTVTVAVTGQFNRVKFGRQVFGISLDDLEECELPGPDEELGEELQTQEEILAFVNERRSLNGLDELSELPKEQTCPCCNEHEGDKQ